MTDEQIQIIVEALNKSSFRDDLYVAIVSGIVILVASSIVSLMISKSTSKKAIDEMKVRAKIEAEETLKVEKSFYIIRAEQADLMEIENLIQSLDREFYEVKLFSIIIINKYARNKQETKSPDLIGMIKDLVTLKESVDNIMSSANKATSLLYQHVYYFKKDELERIQTLIKDIEKICVVLTVQMSPRDLMTESDIEDLEKGVKKYSEKELTEEIERITKEITEIYALIRAIRVKSYYDMKFDK